MKIKGMIFFLIGITFIISINVVAQRITGLMEKDIERYKSDSDEVDIESSPPTQAFLRKAIGNLSINKSPMTPTYEAYFHIPIPFQEQVPILIEVESPKLIDYRFVHLDPPNVIMAARLIRGSTTLDWTAWVFVKENTYADLPDSVPIPTLEQLPDSVKKWLQPTDCVQVDAPIVQEKAALVRGTTTDLMILADNISDYTDKIMPYFPHWPPGLDAVYALTWGSSCTGCAHAGAALFRANGIPARILLNIPIYGVVDMHWIIDYYVPDYGWVRMETQGGLNPFYAEIELVTFACNPEDEFPLFFPIGMEGYWHTSDPVLGMYNPYWGGAHSADVISDIPDSTQKIEQAHSLTDSVFYFYSHYWGINLTSAQDVIFQNAFAYQSSALTDMQAGDLDGYITNMQLALTSYKEVNAEPITTIFYDDFESGLNGWTHGGTEDEWELGLPVYGLTQAHSGDNCWGTDLDSTYENNASCWLASPAIDLSGYACAYLSFWVWNYVEDTELSVHDPLWLDIAPEYAEFTCGDVNGDDAMDLSDVVYLINFLFKGGDPPPFSVRQADVNGDNDISVSDIVYLISYLFKGGPAPHDCISYQPLCSSMGGGNDNPIIPDVGGWTMMVLDLTRYVGDTVQVRWRFASDSDDVQYGSFIDDVHVYGRAVSTVAAK